MDKLILSDHVRKKGKKLVPPLMAAMGDKMRGYSWAKEIAPDLIWIGFLLKCLPHRRAVEIAKIISEIAIEVFESDIKPFFCLLSAFAQLNDIQCAVVKSKVSSLGISDNLWPLAVLKQRFTDFPLSFLVDAIPEASEEHEELLNTTFKELLDRYSTLSTLAMATAGFLGLAQGKIRIATDKMDMLKIFEDISKDPNSDEFKSAASSFRAMVPMFILQDENGNRRNGIEWIDSFWDQMAGFGVCELVRPRATKMEPIPEDPLGSIIFNFNNDAMDDFIARSTWWKFELDSIEQYEVISALLARQTDLATGLAVSHISWTPAIAPILLRALADVFITFSWIVRDPKIRCQAFIDYGLGSAKLEIAHRKAEIEKGNTDPRNQSLIEYLELWISSQRMDHFVEVNLANWSGKTTRQMAEEAGCLDFYNFVYQPFSDAAHSNWKHISIHNMQYCNNPAHHHHRVATCIDHDYDAYYLYLAGEYLNKVVLEFDQFTGFKADGPTAFDNLVERLVPNTDHPNAGEPANAT